MAQNDIYNNKGKYESFVKNFIEGKRILDKPNGNKRKYYCRCKDNFKYYNQMIRSFVVDDNSFVRRNRLLSVANMLFSFIDCDVKNATKEDRENVIIAIRKVTGTSQLKKVEADVHRIGVICFDGDLPDFFKNFKIKTDISRQEARKDKLSYDEYEKIFRFFNDDSVMQCYLAVSFECLNRPQELCYTKIQDVEINENYAYITISEHGKEGIKKLLLIDSFPYLLKMFNEHKKNKDKDSFLFLNEYQNQLKPFAVNKKLKRCLNILGITKPVTCYSLKRFGVTFKRLQGDDDITIQRIAGWKSTKQLRTYDLSNQDDIFKIELAKRGLIKDEKYNKYTPKTKPCDYCGELIGFAESSCPCCKRVVDKEMLKEMIDRQEKNNNKVELLFRFLEEKGMLKDIEKELDKKKD